jgi:heme A synthase
MQNASSLTEITPIADQEEIDSSPEELTPERRVTLWVNRLTGVVGAVFLLLALVAWLARHGHYRLVLAFLIVALFASILHSYTFEDGDI